VSYRTLGAGSCGRPEQIEVRKGAVTGQVAAPLLNIL